MRTVVDRPILAEHFAHQTAVLPYELSLENVPAVVKEHFIYVNWLFPLKLNLNVNPEAHLLIVWGKMQFGGEFVA